MALAVWEGQEAQAARHLNAGVASASDPIYLAESKNGARSMATIEREFYRSARGPAPTDEDTWRLVYDPRPMRLLVRHKWEAAGHNGDMSLSSAGPAW